jgi:hypothetical protein
MGRRKAGDLDLSAPIVVRRTAKGSENETLSASLYSEEYKLLV